jgi:hypothetical protein
VEIDLTNLNLLQTTGGRIETFMREQTVQNTELECTPDLYGVDPKELHNPKLILNGNQGL